MSKPDGGPAFPPSVAEIQGIATNSAEFAMPGMSLRDYFAAQALAMLNYHNILIDALNDREAALQIQNAAVLSYRLADAMIEARSK